MTNIEKRLEEYCKRFGLCKEKGTCQCKKELKFISETFEEGYATAKKIYESIGVQTLDKEIDTLEHIILKAYPDLREIVFHSDGSVVAKSGGRAKNPKKLYTVHPKNGQLPHYGEMAKEAIQKLTKNNICKLQ